MQHKAVAWIVGGLSALFLYWVVGNLFDLSASCWSGWQSPSIGSQGACSHHGGVNRTAEYLAFLFSLSAGVFAGVRYYGKAQGNAAPKEYEGMQGDDRRQEQDGLNRAFSAMCSASIAIFAEAAVVARYCWNAQMRFLKSIGLMPYFRSYWWLFLVAAFVFLAIFQPLGVAFLITAFAAMAHDPRSENDYVVPLRRDEDIE